MTVTSAPRPATAAGMPPRTSLARKFWRRCLRNPATFLSLMFVVLLALVVVAAPLLGRFDPLEQDLMRAFRPPDGQHWFGTDRFGQDIYSRVVHGARLSLAVGFFSVLMGLTAGVGIGLTAGFFGGVTDELLMRFIDVLLAFPGILLAILIVSVLGSSLLNVIVALAVFSVPIFARMARGSVLATKNLEYVDAARAVGAATARILLRHIVPNILGPIVVYATLRMASAILGGATLSFLGMGLAPPAPEWGLMVALGRQQVQSAPHVVFFPGLSIFLTVLAFNLLGDALRDVIDPRSKPV